MVSLQIQVASDGGATFVNFQYGDVEWTQSVEKLNENPIYQINPDQMCYDTQPGTATMNPCASSNCPNKLVTPVVPNQGYQTGNGIVRGRYIYKLDEPNPIVAPKIPSPPPPVWWNPGVTGEIKVNLPYIDEFIDNYFSDNSALENHGCECRNTFVDKFNRNLKSYPDGGLDSRCGALYDARKCVFLEGGICYGRESEDLSYSINNGTCVEDQDTCEGSVCRIDLFFYRKIMQVIEDINFSHETAAYNVPMEQCAKTTCHELEGGCVEVPDFHCCGHAPRVSLFNPEKATCSVEGSKVIHPNINTCKRMSADITIIIDNSAYNQTSFEILRSFLHDWTASMGLGDDSMYNIILYNQVPSVHATQIVSLSELSSAFDSITQSSSGFRNTFSALNYVYENIDNLTREDKNSYFILFTSGPSSDANLAAAEDLRSLGTVYSVGIGANPPQWEELDSISTPIDGGFSSFKIKDSKLNLFHSASMLAERLCLPVPQCANLAKDIIFVLDNEFGSADLEMAKDFIKNFSVDVAIKPHGINAGLVVAGNNGTQIVWGRRTHSFLPEVDHFDSGLDTILTTNLGPLTLDEALIKAANFNGRGSFGSSVPRDIILISDRQATIPENFTGNLFQVNTASSGAQSSAPLGTTYRV